MMQDLSVFLRKNRKFDSQNRKNCGRAEKFADFRENYIKNTAFSGKMKGFYVDYSTYSDIFHVQKKNTHTEESVEMGDFCICFGKQNEVVGIEIEYASEFLGQLGVTKEQLREITDAEFSVDKRNPRAHVIFLTLKFPTATKKISLPMQVMTA